MLLIWILMVLPFCWCLICKLLWLCSLIRTVSTYFFLIHGKKCAYSSCIRIEWGNRTHRKGAHCEMVLPFRGRIHIIQVKIAPWASITLKSLAVPVFERRNILSETLMSKMRIRTSSSWILSDNTTRCCIERNLLSFLNDLRLSNVWP